MTRRLILENASGRLLLIVLFSTALGCPAARAQSPSETVERPKAPLTVDCVSYPHDPKIGQDVIIQSLATSSLERPLRYSFTTDAGKLSLSHLENFAVLSTSDLEAGIVHVTCEVADDEGRTASSRVTIRLTARPSSPAASEGSSTATASSGSSAAPASSGSHASQAGHKAKHKGNLGVFIGGGISLSGKYAGTAAPNEGYAQSELVAKWVEHLKNGKIEYRVPPVMLLHKTTTAEVVIHGFEDINTTTLSGSTGSGALKQSERMKVELLAMDNPGDFTIALKDGDSVRFVPIDSATTWLWNVTPNASGLKQRMMVRASVVYPGPDDKTEQQLPDYTAIVEVDVPSLWTRIKESYQQDPLKWFSYVIPGGAGFTFLAGIAVWLWRRRHKEAATEAGKVGAGTGSGAE